MGFRTRRLWLECFVGPCAVGSAEDVNGISPSTCSGGARSQQPLSRRPEWIGTLRAVMASRDRGGGGVDWRGQSMGVEDGLDGCETGRDDLNDGQGKDGVAHWTSLDSRSPHAEFNTSAKQGFFKYRHHHNGHAHRVSLPRQGKKWCGQTLPKERRRSQQPRGGSMNRKQQGVPGGNLTHAAETRIRLGE